MLSMEQLFLYFHQCIFVHLSNSDIFYLYFTIKNVKKKIIFLIIVFDFVFFFFNKKIIKLIN